MLKYAERGRLASLIPLYGVVGGVDLCRDALGTNAFLGIGETVRVESFDQLSAFPVDLFHRGAGGKAEPVVGGEDVWRIFPGDEGGGCGTPPRGPPCGRLFRRAPLLRPAPLLGGALPGCLERPPEGLATLAACTYSVAEALVFLQAGDEALGEAPQTARDAHCSFLSPGSM